MALSGKTALITGGGRGIGRAVALAFARSGARLALAGRTRHQLDSVAAEVARLGLPTPVVQEMDVAEADSIAAGVERLVAAPGDVRGPPHSAAWARHLAVNAPGPFPLTRAVLPAMLERRWGRIVNIASMAALGGA